MGLLSALGIFQAPEAVLERQLQANPYHPFHLASSEGEDENKVFVYTSRHSWFYLYLAVAIASFLFVIIWPSAGNDSEYVVFGVAVFFLALYLVLETWPQWSIVLEPASHHYSVYHGSHLTVSQHCHNIYVRLVCEKTSSSSPPHISWCWMAGDVEATIHLTRRKQQTGRS
ncbi:hypothetical protein GBAR_LOCUS5652 [Geodia barretti]|uniref:Uncharacterized protein n=1 Tax=Geodia barretti TaxID=519541 RepID=A0AA35W4W1_GEOBA|nr:hypothetical protein GBAR_LOCUS5652 [Geodia barretti]